MKNNKVDPKLKDVLQLLGVGSLLVAGIVAPGVLAIAGPILKDYQRQKWEEDRKEWEKYNPWRLKQLLKRMQESKYVEIIVEDGLEVVNVTEKGKSRLLKYDLENLKLNEKLWDGKWRLIIYDIPKLKKNESELFRRTLRQLKMHKLQKSVYLTPFRCEDEIEYLRQIFGIRDEVLILKVGNLENEAAYKNYFGLS